MVEYGGFWVFCGDYRQRLRTAMVGVWSAVAGEVGGCVGRR